MTDNKDTGAEQKKIQKKMSVKRFFITYVLLMGAFFLLIGLKPIQNIIDINGLYTNMIVWLTTKVIGVMNIPCTSTGSIIRLPSIALDVQFGCNGLEAVMIYSVAIIAFPATWKRKVMGILGGFLVIQVINILRIAALAYAGVHYRKFFEYFHIYVAQGMMIAIALGVFFLYLHYVRPNVKSA